MWLFIPFVAVPLIEIALFIQVGGLIGLWPTLLIVVLTALLGTQLVRTQGTAAMADLRRSLEDLRDPSEPLAHGAMILVAGVLLLTPGFFTDACGFALLVPQIRKAVMRQVAKRITVKRMSYGRPPSRGPRRPDVVEGEFQELEPTKRPTHRPSGSPSGWTRH